MYILLELLLFFFFFTFIYIQRDTAFYFEMKKAMRHARVIFLIYFLLRVLVMKKFHMHFKCTL